jgi:hypothetical protein
LKEDVAIDCTVEIRRKLREAIFVEPYTGVVVLPSHRLAFSIFTPDARTLDDALHHYSS